MIVIHNNKSNRKYPGSNVSRSCTRTYRTFLHTFIQKPKREGKVGIAPLDSHWLPDTSRATRRPVPFRPAVARNIGEDIPPLKIDEDGVITLLRNIKLNKAAGPDELPNTGMCSWSCTSYHSNFPEVSWLRWTANVAPISKMETDTSQKTTAQCPWPVSVILDFSKAFDTVPQRKLLHKLDAHSIKRSSSQLVHLLTQRSMCMVVEE